MQHIRLISGYFKKQTLFTIGGFDFGTQFIFKSGSVVAKQLGNWIFLSKHNPMKFRIVGNGYLKADRSWWSSALWELEIWGKTSELLSGISLKHHRKFWTGTLSHKNRSTRTFLFPLLHLLFPLPKIIGNFTIYYFEFITNTDSTLVLSSNISCHFIGFCLIPHFALRPMKFSDLWIIWSFLHLTSPIACHISGWFCFYHKCIL